MALAIITGFSWLLPSFAADSPQWGRALSRNMISDETGLPQHIDLTKDIKWKVSLGTDAYSTPTIAAGKVFIGANNAKPRDTRHKGDRGVLLCLNEANGDLNWQLVVPRIPGDIYKDWPKISICSPATIEGDRAYTVTNRFEVVCLDLNGQTNGNDGPYLDEGRHMTPADDEPLSVTPLDADIIWLFDMPADAGTYPHDSAHASILIDGDYLYLNTCNGVDNTHQTIQKPDAPSLIVLNKHTGHLVAWDTERIGPNIFHSTWSSPALSEVNGQRLVCFGGGDGICYTFKALKPGLSPASPLPLELAWRFDCDPTAPKVDVRSHYRNRQEGPSNILSTPVFYKNRIYVTVGGDIWWGKRQSWLICVDAAQTGDITHSARLWSYPMNHHCCTSVSIRDGLLFMSDCGGTLHCLDPETGQPFWTHELKGEIWGSTLVADGKVYVGTHRSEFWILAASKEKQVLDQVRFDAPISSTPVAANGVLYIATRRDLYAIQTADATP